MVARVKSTTFNAVCSARSFDSFDSLQRFPSHLTRSAAEWGTTCSFAPLFQPYHSPLLDQFSHMPASYHTASIAQHPSRFNNSLKFGNFDVEGATAYANQVGHGTTASQAIQLASDQAPASTRVQIALKLWIRLKQDSDPLRYSRADWPGRELEANRESLVGGLVCHDLTPVCSSQLLSSKVS